jgi:hypothetical protein
MASTSPVKDSRAWRTTVLLTVSALPAGAWFASSTCYWQGRTFSAGDRLASMMLNWQPSLAPWYVGSLIIGIAWVVFWFLHARRTRTLGPPYLHAVLPMAAFGFAAVILSDSAMACGAY